MPGLNIDQVFDTNPITSNASTDLMYFGQSPYGLTNDAAMTYSHFAAQFPVYDTNKNISANNILSGYATTATAAALTTLTVASKYQQYFTGSTTQTVVLPVTSTLVLGQSFYIVNDSTGVVTVEASGGSGDVIQAMAAGTSLLVTCILLTGATPASWATSYSLNAPLSLPLSLANGGTGAALTASNGGIFYSNATTGAILAGTATAQQLLTSGASTTPVWTTSTYPLTNAANTLLYASSANVMAALATQVSSGLLTNGSGVPAWVTVTGTGAPVLATSPTLVTPTLGVAAATSINFGGTALSNYTEGLWTPIDASGATLTFTLAVGNYIRIGTLVTASCAVTYPVTANGAAATIGGLPFATGASAGKQGGSVIYTTVSTLVYAATGSGGTTVGLYTAAGGAISNVTMSTATVYLQVVYQL